MRIGLCLIFVFVVVPCVAIGGKGQFVTNVEFFEYQKIVFWLFGGVAAAFIIAGKVGHHLYARNETAIRELRDIFYNPSTGRSVCDDKHDKVTADFRRDIAEMRDDIRHMRETMESRKDDAQLNKEYFIRTCDRANRYMDSVD